jgi:hypothetical protein
LLHAGYFLIIIGGGAINNFFIKEDWMLKHALKIIVLACAILSVAAVTEATAYRQAKAIASIDSIFIIGTDNYVYQYSGTAWRQFTRALLKDDGTTGSLPATLTGIAVDNEGGEDRPYVLASNSRIYFYVPPYGKWIEAHQGTSVNARVIATGYDPTAPRGQGSMRCWKIGTDKKIYYYMNDSWTNKQNVLGPRSNETWVDPNPANQHASALAVDTAGFGFALVPIKMSDGSSSNGHVQWQFSIDGTDHNSNPYNVACAINNNLPSLDIYGQQYVSLTDKVMCFSRQMNSTTWTLCTIQRNDCLYYMDLGYMDGTTQRYLTNILGVTGNLKITNGNPWIIAKGTKSGTNYTNAIWKSALQSVSGNIKYLNWTVVP